MVDFADILHDENPKGQSMKCSICYAHRKIVNGPPHWQRVVLIIQRSTDDGSLGWRRHHQWHIIGQKPLAQLSSCILLWGHLSWPTHASFFCQMPSFVTSFQAKDGCWKMPKKVKIPHRNRPKSSTCWSSRSQKSVCFQRILFGALWHFLVLPGALWTFLALFGVAAGVIAPASKWLGSCWNIYYLARW